MVNVIDMEYKNINRVFDVVYKSLFRIDGNLSYDRTLDAIELLCKLVKETDTDESVWYIGESLETTLDNLIVGAYWFMVDYHGGQGSKEYRLQCIIGDIFNPGMSSGPEEDTGEQFTYNALEVLKGK